MPLVLAASTTETFALVLLAILLVGWALYLITNVRRGRREAGAEIELAPNRKPYYTDEELEGPTLERTQLAGFLLVVVVAAGLPA